MEAQSELLTMKTALERGQDSSVNSEGLSEEEFGLLLERLDEVNSIATTARGGSWVTADTPDHSPIKVGSPPSQDQMVPKGGGGGCSREIGFRDDK